MTYVDRLWRAIPKCLLPVAGLILLSSSVSFADDDYKSVILHGQAPEYASLANPMGLPTGSQARTVEGWIKTSDGTDQAMLDFGTDAGIGHEWATIVGQSRIWLALNGARIVWAAPNITDGRWHHVAVVYNGNGGLASNTFAYMDNQIPLMVTELIDIVPDTSSDGVLMGATFSTPFIATFFNGNIAEVRVWNVAKSAQEIADGMYSHLSGKESGLAAYWKLNGKFKDKSNNQLNLNTGADKSVYASTDGPF